MIWHLGWIGWVVSAVVVGCAPQKPSDVDDAQQLGLEADDDPRDRQQVVARIDGDELELEEFERRLDGLVEFAAVRFYSTDARKELLTRMVGFEVMADVAQDKGYGTDARVRDAIKEAMAQLFIEDHLRQTVSMADIDEQQRRAYFEDHRREFHRPERRRIARVVVDDQDEAQALWRRWRQRSLEDVDDPSMEFRRFAFAHSAERQTGDEGGVVGWFEPGDEYRTGADIFEWTPGEARGPVAIDEGYALEMVVEVKPEERPSFEELKQELTTAVYEQQRQKTRRQFIEGLTRDADVKMWDDRVEDLEAVAPSADEIPQRIDDIPRASPESDESTTLETEQLR